LHWEWSRQEKAPALARITLGKVQLDITWQTAPVEVLLHISTGLLDTSMAQRIMHTPSKIPTIRHRGIAEPLGAGPFHVSQHQQPILQSAVWPQSSCPVPYGAHSATRQTLQQIIKHTTADISKQKIINMRITLTILQRRVRVAKL
jgi:hypothetical protein